MRILPEKTSNTHNPHIALKYVAITDRCQLSNYINYQTVFNVRMLLNLNRIVNPNDTDCYEHSSPS